MFKSKKSMMILLSAFALSSCATMRDSILLGAGSGVVLGGLVGSQTEGNQGENAIKGAVVGGVVLGLAAYLIHGSLEKRDASVRRETLMNLEKYDVVGFDSLSGGESPAKEGNCFVTKDVDGKTVSIPCSLANDSAEYH